MTGTPEMTGADVDVVVAEIIDRNLPNEEAAVDEIIDKMTELMRQREASNN